MQPGPALVPPDPRRRSDAGIVVLVAWLATTPYLGLLWADFLNWDDDRFITNNPLFSGSIASYVWAAVSTVQFEAYQPFHLLSYLPDRLLWKGTPAGFHALNILLFSSGIAFLYTLLRRTTDRWSAAFAVMLLAWHPLMIESVAWVTARKDLVAFLFVVGVLHVEDRWSERRGPIPSSLALALAAMLSKTSAVVLPIIVVSWHVWVRGRPTIWALRRTAPMALLAIGVASFVAQLWTRSSMILPSRPLPLPVDVAGTLGFYLSRVLWPQRLSPLYPAVVDGQEIFGGLLLLALVLIAVFWRRLPPAARFAAVVSLGSLLPYSNVLPLYFRFADRYAFLALVALVWPCAVALAVARRRLTARPAVGIALVATLLVVECTVTFLSSRAWQNSLALWTRATASQPRAFFAFLKLGETHRQHRDWVLASRAYLRAIELDPESSLGFVGLLVTAAARSEDEGTLPRGTGDAWLARLERSPRSRSALSHLMVEMRSAGCPRCAYAVLWLSLKMFPTSDPDLFALAAQALAQDIVDAAALLLHEVKEKRSDEYARLDALLKARIRPPQAPRR